MIKVVWNARSWMKVTQVRNVRDEAVSIELMVKSNNINSQLMIPSCQPSTVLQCVKLGYKIEKLLKTVTMITVPISFPLLERG